MKTKMAAENSHLIIMKGLITGNKCLQKDYFHIQSSFKVYSKCDNCFIVVFVNLFPMKNTFLTIPCIKFFHNEFWTKIIPFLSV